MAHARNQRPRGALHDETAGAIYVEFIIAFIPFFIMVLGMMQLALMYSAHLVVQHAANVAARSAVVTFPDCEYHYDGAAQHDANGGGRADNGNPVEAVGGLFGGVSAVGGLGFPSGGGGGGGGGGDPGSVYSRGGGRLDVIRYAASMPLVATSPSLEELRADADPRRQSIFTGIGGGSSPALRLAVGAMAYNNAAVAVTFPQSERGTSYAARFNSRAPMVTRVTYLFHCGIPIVAAIACDDALSLYSGVPTRALREAMDLVRSGRASPSEIARAYEGIRDARARLDSARPGMSELGASAAGYGVSAVLLGLTGGHYSVIRAEAVLPNQGTDGNINSACYRRGR